MKFINRFKGAIVVVAMLTIALAISFYYPAGQDTEVMVNEDFISETAEPAVPQESIPPATEDFSIETADHTEIEGKKDMAPISSVPMETQEAVLPVDEESPTETEDHEEAEDNKGITPDLSVPLKVTEPEAETEIQEEAVEKSTLLCSLTVRCDTLLNNMDSIAPEKKHLIPENGSILSETELEFSDGESVFDVLARELKKRGIHFEFSKVPMYDSFYIEGIGNLYEFDAGNLSGWTYRVNGETLPVGCSQCKVKNGDKIEFLYTCNMGKDL